MILNRKVPVVKMRPLISRLPRGGGGGGSRGAMVTPHTHHSPHGFKDDCTY